MGAIQASRCLTLLLAGLFVPVVFADSYSFQTIDLPGAFATTITGINNAGDFVGYSNLGPFLYAKGAFSRS